MRKFGLIGGALLAGAALFTLAVGSNGCDKVECGTGTIELDGVCVSMPPGGDAGFTSAQCDLTESTFVGGICRPKFPHIECATGMLTFDDAGVGTCSSMGMVSCDVPRPCPAAQGDMICVSGRVFEGAEHAKAVTDMNTLNEIEVRVYEPLAFLSDPTSPPFARLTLANGGLDNCGRWLVRFNTSVDTSNGLVAFTATDKMGASPTKYVLGATASRPQSGVNIMNKPAYLVSKTQDMTWSTMAGLTGRTFSSVGTLAVRFHLKDPGPDDPIPGTPVAGITPAWNNTVRTADDHFFSDTPAALDDTKLTAIDGAATKTGPNGVAFVTIGPGLGNIFPQTGAGSCIKPAGGTGTATVDTTNTLAGAAVGVIFFFDLPVKCE